MLRTQTQAYYAPENHGYSAYRSRATRTSPSPIRRYAGLLAHRALVSAYKLGPGGPTAGKTEATEAIGQGVSRRNGPI